jgi:hypothetical protein
MFINVNVCRLMARTASTPVTAPIRPELPQPRRADGRSPARGGGSLASRHPSACRGRDRTRPPVRTRQAISPVIPSSSRLVASTRSPGQACRMASTGPAGAPQHTFAVVDDQQSDSPAQVGSERIQRWLIVHFAKPERRERGSPDQPLAATEARSTNHAPRNWQSHRRPQAPGGSCPRRRRPWG